MLYKKFLVIHDLRENHQAYKRCHPRVGGDPGAFLYEHVQGWIPYPQNRYAFHCGHLRRWLQVFAGMTKGSRRGIMRDNPVAND